MVIDTTLPSAEFVLGWNMGIPGSSVPSEYRVELLNAQRTKVADLWQAMEYRYFTAATPQPATYYLVVTNDPPPSDQNFKADQRIYGVQLTWNPVQVADLAGYVIRYGTQSGEYPFLAQVGKNNTMTEIMGLSEDRDYFFRITAIDRTGLEGPLSLTTGHPCIPEAHHGDVDCSGLIDYLDLLFLAHEWQTVETTATLDFDNDFDHDDLLLFLSLWHKTP
jgi:fibronectin type 3 domain-containing protein